MLPLLCWFGGTCTTHASHDMSCVQYQISGTIASWYDTVVESTTTSTHTCSSVVCVYILYKL